MPTILEDYFDFSEPEEIRIQGHRVYLHHVLFDYVDGATFEKLCQDFETLSKDKVLACLLYYHRNQEAMNKYLAEIKAYQQQQRDRRQIEQADLRADLHRRRAALDLAREGQKDSV
jgi:uncharacterized protein (DUF433 family)